LRSEGLDVDFKRDARGLHSEDLVAFANAHGGGAILVGVAETTDSLGRQVGTVVCCRTGDGERLQIVNRAQECIPPVRVEVIEEIWDDHALFRVEIPSSNVRPHCTSAGTYKVRVDGRNRPLRPDEIAAILLEREPESFRARFADATTTLARTLEQVVSEVQNIEADLHMQLKSIAGSADDAASEASDSAWSLRSLEDAVTSLQGSEGETQEAVLQLHERVAYMMQAADVPDVVADREKKALRRELEAYMEAHPAERDEWINAVVVDITSSHSARLTKEQVDEVVNAVFKEARARRSRDTAAKKKRKTSPRKKRQ